MERTIPIVELDGNCVAITTPDGKLITRLYVTPSHAFADQLSQVLMSFYENGRKDVQTQAKAVFGFAP